MARPDGIVVGLSPQIAGYLDQLVASGLYGGDRGEVLQTLTLAGLRDAYERGHLKLTEDHGSDA